MLDRPSTINDNAINRVPQIECNVLLDKFPTVTEIENTMFMSFDMKFIKRDQKTSYQNTFTWYSIYHAIISCVKTVELCVENIEFVNILFELCDVASRLLTCYGDVIQPIER